MRLYLTPSDSGRTKFFCQKIKNLQPGRFLIRFMGVQHLTGIIRETEEENMEQIIRRLIRAAVESFPIDRKKKADILQRLTKETAQGGEHHEL